MALLSVKLLSNFKFLLAAGLICCDIKLNIVICLSLGQNLVKPLIPLISFSRKTYFFVKKHFWATRTQHFNSSKTLFRLQVLKSLNSELFHFCLERAAAEDPLLEFQFRVETEVSLLKSPSNYWELIYEKEFLLKLLEYQQLE